MASIRQLPNGRWKGRYRDPNGRPRSVTRDTRKEVTQFIEDQGSAGRRGEWIDPKASREKFETWADRWWDTTAGLAETTRRGYWQMLNSYVLPAFKGMKVVDIDFMDVESFIAHLRKRGLSQKKIRDVVSVLSGIMKCAVHARVRRDNPASGHSLPLPARRIRPGDVLDMEELHRLAAEMREPYGLAVWVMALAGLRPSEMCGLQVRHIDFPRRILHVQRGLVPVNKYDKTPRHLQSRGTKTRAGDRDIPLPGWLCDDLATMLAERAQQTGSPVGRDDPLFTTRPLDSLGRKKRPLPLDSGRWRQDELVPALKRAGLDPTIRTYDLRHSHASMLIALGANPLEVMQRMGHTHPATTLGTYGHLFHGAQENLTQKLDQHRTDAQAAAERKTRSDGVVSLQEAAESILLPMTKDVLRRKPKTGAERRLSGRTKTVEIPVEADVHWVELKESPPA